MLKCPKCNITNRVDAYPDNLQPICGRCGASLLADERSRSVITNLVPKSKARRLTDHILLGLIACVAYGILATPSYLQKKHLPLLEAERLLTEEVQRGNAAELLVKRDSFAKELDGISAESLRRSAAKNYEVLLSNRKSFDEKFALSPREKTQLRMRNIASDSTRLSNEAIRAVAKEASPDGADISVRESFEGIVLSIDFDMSSMTSGEKGVFTKHETIGDLRKEVVSIMSRAANDVLQFCMELDVSSVFIGCRHYVEVEHPGGATKTENWVLYKVEVKGDQIAALTSDPFLGLYSITKDLKVVEDEFDGLTLITTTSNLIR